MAAVTDFAHQVDEGGMTIVAQDFAFGAASPGQQGSFSLINNWAVIKVVVEDVNFNAANTDTPVTFALPAGTDKYKVASIHLTNASASISTATVGVFTGAGGTGQTLAANQAITVTATATDTVNNTQSLTLTNATTEAYNDTTLFVRVGTAQGSAATADVVFHLSLMG